MSLSTGSRPRVYELQPGERIAGRIIRLPQPGRPHGNRCFLERLSDGEVVALPATAKAGHSVLERELRDKCAPGDAVEIAYHGKRLTQDGERAYRFYEVTLGRPNEGGEE